MINFPSFVTPYNTVIDATDPNSTFGFMINCDGGTPITQIDLILRDYNLNTYQDWVDTSTHFNGDIINVKLSEFRTVDKKISNGNDYKFNILMISDFNDNYIGGGYVAKNSGNTAQSFFINETSSVLPFANANIVIKGETRAVQSYDSSTRLCTLKTPLTFVPGDNNEIYEVYTKSVWSPLYTFKARKNPTLTITKFDGGLLPDKITGKSFVFKGNYAQEQNTSWALYKWDLYDSNNFLIKTTDWVNTANMIFEFDGFINNNDYTIKLNVENIDGVFVSASHSFLVEYEAISIETPVKVSKICDNNAVDVSWGAIRVNDISFVTASETPYSFVDNTPVENHTSILLANDVHMKCSLSDTSLNKYNIPKNSTVCVFLEISSDTSVINLNTDKFFNLRTATVYVKNGYKLVQYKEFYENENGSIIEKEIDSLLLPQNTEIGDWIKLYIYENRVVAYIYKLPKALSCFSPPNTYMTGNGKLFNDYNLKDTDVLYN